MNEALFLRNDGTIFAIVRDYESSVKLWQQHRWTLQVRGAAYQPQDFRGREALENLFVRKIHVSRED